MQKLSDQILKLLQGGEALKEARLKALKITNEIQGFGSSMNSPTSSSPNSLFSEAASQASSSFCSFSNTSSPVSFIDSNEQINKYTEEDYKNMVPPKNNNNNNVDKNHLWDGLAGEEKNVLVDSDDEDGEVGKPRGFVSEICSKIIGNGEKIEFRCISDVGNKVSNNKKKYERQYSLWF